MKKTLVTLGLVLTLFSCTNSGLKHPSEIPYKTSDLTVTEAYDLVENYEGITVLDVRKPSEIKESGKIDGALTGYNFMDGESFVEEVSKLDKEKVYVVYCKIGKRSEKAKRKMYDLGFKRVYDIDEGFNAWKEKGYSVEN